MDYRDVADKLAAMLRDVDAAAYERVQAQHRAVMYETQEANRLSLYPADWTPGHHARYGAYLRALVDNLDHALAARLLRALLG